MAGNTHPRPNDNYHAFLVRVSRGDASQPWVTVAKDVATGEEYPLPDPDALLQFLTEHLPVFHPRTRGSAGGKS